MPEFRQNIATKEWVIIATERAKRKRDFVKPDQGDKELPEHDPKCPFCPGNEDKTPPEVFSLKRDGHWAVRVVPNKFAAVNPKQTTDRYRCGKFLCAGGYGIAEVIIESRQHNQTLATMELGEVEDVAAAYRERYRAIQSSNQINLITVFRNHGARAGTSLVHPHSQIIATPIVPPHVRDPIHQAMLSYDTYGNCVYCDTLNEELNQEERIVLENDHFVAFCPYASRTPFEMRIYPRRHIPALGDTTDEELKDFASVLRTMLWKLYVALDNPDYNFIIRSAPVGDQDARFLHWYVVIIPKVTTPAGFEIGTGIYINVTKPEDCAADLREIEGP